MTLDLLIVWHSRTGTSEALARAAAAGAGKCARLLRCDEVDAHAMLAAKGYIFCAPENLAALSGMMKEFFDRLYYPLLGRIEGRAYGSIIAAGSDGQGAQAQLDRIATGWRLRRVSAEWIARTDAQSPEDIVAAKTIAPADLERASALGAALAEGLKMGIF